MKPTKPTRKEDQVKKRRLRLPLARRTSSDERGLSTLEWILLVAAVGGLATAGVIIVRNAVGDAGDQVDDTARTERLAQIDVNAAIRTSDTGTNEGDSSISHGEVRTRCNFDRFYKPTSGVNKDKKIYPLRQWRGSFTLRFVTERRGGANIDTWASGKAPTQGDAVHWCDAVPTNNLSNNPADFAGPIRTNFKADSLADPGWPS